MRKSWDGLGKGKILYMLYSFHVLSTMCILKSLEQNISYSFGLGYGVEDLLGLRGFLFVSFKITTPELCWSCLGI